MIRYLNAIRSDVCPWLTCKFCQALQSEFYEIGDPSYYYRGCFAGAGDMHRIDTPAIFQSGMTPCSHMTADGKAQTYSHTMQPAADLEYRHIR